MLPRARRADPAVFLQAVRTAAARLSAGPPPISVLDCIDRWDGRDIVVLEDRLHPGLRGGLSLVDGRWLIILNRDDPPPRARFTLAHELGHIVLGDCGGGRMQRDDWLHPDDRVHPDHRVHPDKRAASVQRPLRVPLSSTTREALCDRFAVERLLPASLVRYVWAAEPAIATLAGRFQVSSASARRRVRELGLSGPAASGRTRRFPAGQGLAGRSLAG